MQSGLFLLTLLGQCCLITCALYEYHFIKGKKTWAEAKSHCADKYTALATVYDMTDVTRLTCHVGQGNDVAWIGLHKQTQSNRTWKWSQSGVEFIGDMWDTNEPNDFEPGLENCVTLSQDQKWLDDNCDEKYQAICYNGSHQACDRFSVTPQTMNWREAQSFCREQHTDLISGLGQLNDTREGCNVTGNESYWIGLFRDTWVWSDNRSSSFRHWDQASPRNDSCAVADLSNSGKWRDAECGEKNPFFCLKDKTVLIKENKTWQEALDYCRGKHYDLLSIMDLNQQIWSQDRAKMADSDFIWLGMRYTCTLGFWFWVTGELVYYKNWDQEPTGDLCSLAVAMETGGPHKWFTRKDNEMFNFICLT